MRVLIADDQPGVGHTVALLVNAAKHHVVKVVTSGADAIRAYHTHRPDVVLMDYTMSRLNGADTFLPKTPQPVLFSSQADPRVSLRTSEPLPSCRSRWTSRNLKRC